MLPIASAVSTPGPERGSAGPMEVPGDAVEAYRRDGAVVIRGVLDGGWLEELAKGVAFACDRPGRHRAEWACDAAAGHRFLFDAVTVPGNPHFERYALRSPIGQIAARMMGSSTALAFYVTMFLRSPGTGTRTPWHQDQTYWCVDGRQALSIWTSLEPVPAGTELEFVRGSHLWDRPLAQPVFEHGRLGGTRESGPDDAVPVPDFAAGGAHEVVGWPMDPGDILIFHGMTVHGGSGNLPAGTGRRSVSVQWLGEDARVTTRPGGCSPDWLPELAQHGIGPGDYPRCAMCPMISAEGATAQQGTLPP